MIALTLPATPAAICTRASARQPRAGVAAAAPGHRPFAAGRSAARPLRLRVGAAAAATAEDTKYAAWEVIFKDLASAGVPSLTPEQAFDEAELGRAVVIDVRPQEDYDQAHPRGAVHIPAFLTIQVGNAGSVGEFGKWLACKANGVTPTKPNPELARAVAAAAAGGKAVILACEAGGTLEPSVNFPTGKVSRSLKAAWKVLSSQQLPADKIKHLAGGVYGWAQSGLPMTGEYDGSNAGRTPNVAKPPSS